jgi:hypothetical protein
MSIVCDSVTMVDIAGLGFHSYLPELTRDCVSGVFSDQGIIRASQNSDFGSDWVVVDCADDYFDDDEGFIRSPP